MVKYLSIGPGAMGYFLYLGVVSKLKMKGQLDELEEISGASAGGLLGFLFCATRGDVAKCLDFSLDVPVKQIMKPNIKNLVKNYGLVSVQKIRQVLQRACTMFLGKDDVTFKELYEWYPVKLHLAAYCVDLMKTVYFSVDSVPNMSVLDIVCATIAIPFLFTSIKLEDGWNYIDGGAAETTPSSPFLGKNDVLAMRLGWGIPVKVKDIKTYSMSILYSTMKMRYNYDVPSLVIELNDNDVFDFSATNDVKLRMFLSGHRQIFS